MNESGVKQQIVDNIQNVDTILVTVGSNPSVDELSAALGLTMYLNDLGKHATAVMSGAIPPAINFLEPEKTFEPTIDSLRDFVIALDKDKADHLRYKVEGDVVKIFITPYKTVITNKDLEYSQGDYNVEMVIALGVTDQDHLDKALAAHGKIFHDAIVATIGLAPSTLGTIDWVEETASSLSELATSLAGSFQDPEKPMTSQVASALLTGIVAATDRFSNDKTTSQTMSVSAVLMAAGANQQLIASKLREGAKLPLQDDGKKRSIAKSTDKTAEEQQKRRDGGLSIAHKNGSGGELRKDAADLVQKSKQDTKPQADKRPVSDQTTEQPQKPADALEAALEKTRTNQDKPAVDSQPNSTSDDSKTPEDILSEQLAAVAPATPAPVAAVEFAETPSPEVSSSKSALDLADTPGEPSLGGTLNATTEQAAQDKHNADAERNKTILSHGNGQYVGDGVPTFESPLNGAGQTGEQPSIDPFANLGAAAPAASVEPLAPATPAGTLADIDEQSRGGAGDPTSPPVQSDAALDAVNAVVNAAPDQVPFDPMAAIAQATPASPDTSGVPGAPMTPPPPPMPDFSQLPPLPPPPVFPQADMPPAAPAMPPVQPLGPQIPELPQAPLPPEQLGSVLPEAPNQPLQEVGPVDPKQFKIPGQQ